MDHSLAIERARRIWDDSVLPALIEYIRIPAKSPQFDPDWAANGHIDQALNLTRDWCAAEPIAGMQIEVVRLAGRTPVLLVEIAGTGSGTVLLYGHVDKQPEMTGWDDGFGPWVPVVRDGKLYGRGGADDGYAAFAALTAIRLLQEQRVSHGRCILLIEASEESGSQDLPFYLDVLSPRIGAAELVIGLDSGCGNYDQLWVTSSLRGLVNGVLSVEVLSEGVHSGDAGGTVPSSFRILRSLLDRLEDAATGEILLASLRPEIPVERVAQARAAAKTLGDGIYQKFPWVPGAQPISKDLAELILNRSWRPSLSVTGADGLPAVRDAGNVHRPGTSVKLSLRLPPTVDATQTAAALKKLFESDPPHGAQIRFKAEQTDNGWHAPPLAPWLEHALQSASAACFGAPAIQMGEGVTIPFIAMLGNWFPSAQCLITGVLGPKSNAHGPNEFLHLSMARRLTAALASVIADHRRNHP